MTTTRTNTLKETLIAGAAAEGDAALLGWRGQGPLTHEEFTALATAAGVAASDLPSTGRDERYVTRALAPLKREGYTVERETGQWCKGDDGKVRAYRFRWKVSSRNRGAKVGDSAGPVVLTAALLDGDSELQIEGDEQLGARVNADYQARLGAQNHAAGDVTRWLSGYMRNALGAIRMALGWYVPAHAVDAATLLAATFDAAWGREWTSPPYPVTTSEQIAIGIARGFVSEITAVRETYDRAVRDAVKAGRQVTSTRAATLLAELADVDSRLDAYQVLVGREVLADAIADMRALRDELQDIATDSAIRFAMLELDVEPVTPVADERSGSEVVADALAARQAELGARMKVETIAPVAKVEGAAFKPYDEVITRAAPSDPANADSAERFSLLELD